MKKIKIGCVGLRRGMDLLRCAATLDFVEITAVCDINEAALERALDELKRLGTSNVKGYTSYEEFLCADTEAVILATPATDHVSFVKEAMASGKHVLSEIPAVQSLEEAKRLKEIVQAYPDVKYMSGENCCFFNFVKAWKKMYEDGLLGDIFYAEADYIHDIRHLMRDEKGCLTWRAHYDSIKYITHDVGVLLYILSDEVESVSAFTPGIKVTDDKCTGSSNQIGIFRTKKGTIIKMTAAFAVNARPSHNYLMYGTKGSLERDRNAEWTKADTISCFNDACTGKEQRSIIPIAEDEGEGHGSADLAMVKEFLLCLVNDTSVPIDVDMGIKMSLPGIYAAMSARENGRVIQMPDL